MLIYARLRVLFFLITLSGLPVGAAVSEPLFDWSEWEKYRSGVAHPSGVLKAADVVRARENLRRYPWARTYAENIERAARSTLARLTPAMVTTMIPTTTPGDPKFTPCPACREQAKPIHPHGQWTWREAAPEQLTCEVCHTVFPNENHPETITLTTKWGRSQTLSFYAGDPFVIFGYRTGRPSFTANIRARKVRHMADLCRGLAEAYLLTGKTEYASAARLILLRFAECYPHWLVHTGYGEYADLDPRTASQFILQLPEPELCVPPNQPDYRLHTGYWTAGRATGGGQESGFVRSLVEAFDFTCTATHPTGAPVFTDAERRTIERDLLLESTLLLVCDKPINNKSVGNRTAAALVGLCVGHPGLVRFGWDGFQQTVDDWFLPDGTTSESPAYAIMTLSNIWELPQALRGYSEPADYTGPDRRRRVAVDLYHATAYERVWENLCKGLRGDLRFPAFADSYRTSSLSAHFVELLAANYPERSEYLALLKEHGGPDLSQSPTPVALYFREPGLETKHPAPLVLPDWIGPDLRIGHMRTGATGRESLLLLSASHWGGHHHLDSLNLTYWKQGEEILSDLGYLWDHPRKHQTARTLAHNTVLIDEKDQATKDRGGDVVFFRTSPHVKVMEASSRAYAAATLYRRTAAVIDHGEGQTYVVDCFRVQGGRRQDYVFHGSAPECTILGATVTPSPIKLYDLDRVRALTSAGVWRATWPAGPQTAVAWSLPQVGERAFVADGWGQREWKNTDVGATLPYIVRRTESAEIQTFLTVWAAHAGAEPFVRNVERTATNDGLVITTAIGTDYVLCALDTGTLAFPRAGQAAPIRARFAVASLRHGQVAWTFSEPAKN